MPKLTALFVQNLWKNGEPARHQDADCPGLYLQVSSPKAASWILRYQLDGKRVWMGLGPYPSLGLAEAREKARAERRVARVDKIDPLATRRAEQSRQRAELSKQKTVRQLIEEYAEVKSHGWAADTTRRFRLDIANHVLSKIGDMLARDVNVATVKTVLDPIWLEKPALSRALQNHIAGIWDYALFYGIATLNPARNIQRFLPKQPKGGHFRALPFEEIPDFFTALHEYQLSQDLTDPRYDKRNAAAAAALFDAGMSVRDIATTFDIKHHQTVRIWIQTLRPGIWTRGKCHDRPHWTHRASRNWSGPPPASPINYRKLAAHALEFLILTGPLRSGEVLTTVWREIDEDRKLLTIARSRMKNKKGEGDHIVPLTDRVMAIIQKIKIIRHNDYLFPGSALTNRKQPQDKRWRQDAPKAIGCHLSTHALLEVLHDRFPSYTVDVHGFRKSFTNWAYASGRFRDIVIELSLDHAYGNQVHRAYRDERLVEERRELLQAWSDYCNGRTANIIRLPTPVTRTA